MFRTMCGLSGVFGSEEYIVKQEDWAVKANETTGSERSRPSIFQAVMGRVEKEGSGFIAK